MSAVPDRSGLHGTLMRRARAAMERRLDVLHRSRALDAAFDDAPLPELHHAGDPLTAELRVAAPRQKRGGDRS